MPLTTLSPPDHATTYPCRFRRTTSASIRLYRARNYWLIFASNARRLTAARRARWQLAHARSASRIGQMMITATQGAAGSRLRRHIGLEEGVRRRGLHRFILIDIYGAALYPGRECRFSLPRVPAALFPSRFYQLNASACRRRCRCYLTINTHYLMRRRSPRFTVYQATDASYTRDFAGAELPPLSINAYAMP